jgi:hypothetical protein
MAKRKRELTPAEKRERIYAAARDAFKRLQAGEAITEREARLLRKMYDSFIELNNIFAPSIKKVLKAQSREIDNALEDADIDDEDDEDDDD